jgi:hydrogenase/urease accessory protein HupE
VILRRLLAALVLAVLVGPAARAHEVRPALLQITEDGPGHYQVLWKQPTLGDVAIRLAPHLSGGALEAPPTDQFAAPGFLVKTWSIAAKTPLDGQTVTIEGLDQTITDVLVRLATGDGRHIDAVIAPQHPSLKLELAAPQGLAVPAYLQLGVEHILTGFDHLMFVFGMLLLVGVGWRIVKAVSAFTVAHSITLTAAALGFVHVPSAVIECLVALSIVFVAAELLPRPGRELTLTRRHPWLIAFVFGLLHGFAFVEIGQLMFIAAAVAAIYALRWLRAHIRLDLTTPARLAPPYVIGSFAAFWFIERLTAAFPQ